MRRPALVAAASPVSACVLACVLACVVACGAASSGAPAAKATAAAPAGPVEPPPPSGPPVAIDCGDFASCAVVQGGEVRCWGRDKVGELGDGGGEPRRKSVPVPGVAHAKSVAMASRFACALLESGGVTCWGTGRIANDDKPREHARPVPVAGVEGAVELAASGAMACARTPAGVTCWGADGATIGEPPKGELTRLAVGFTHACALDKKGKPTCWGAGDWGAGKKPLFAKPAISGAKAIATGDRHACVVSSKDTVLCWGQNDAGQLGTKPDASPHAKPVTVKGVTKVAKVVAGEASTCAIGIDGAVTCWGENDEGELGFGRKSSDERPARPPAIPDADDLCIGSMHACAFTRDRKVLCWGSNNDGQLGDGGTKSRLDPAPIAW